MDVWYVNLLLILRVNLRNEPLGGHSNILESVLKKLGFVSFTFVWQSRNPEVHYRVMTNYNHVIWDEWIAVKSAFILHCFFLWSEGWMGEGASLKEPGKNKTTQGERERTASGFQTCDGSRGPFVESWIKLMMMANKNGFIQMTPNMAKVRWKRQRHPRKVSR